MSESVVIHQAGLISPDFMKNMFEANNVIPSLRSRTGLSPSLRSRVTYA